MQSNICTIINFEVKSWLDYIISQLFIDEHL
jgi:hypothetical protein